MERKERAKGSRFMVDLGDVKLPSVVEEQVESEIRAVVLRALADPNLSAPREVASRAFDKFTGRTRGLWLNPENPERGTWSDVVSR